MLKCKYNIYPTSCFWTYQSTFCTFKHLTNQRASLWFSYGIISNFNLSIRTTWPILIFGFHVGNMQVCATFQPSDHLFIIYYPLKFSTVIVYNILAFKVFNWQSFWNCLTDLVHQWTLTRCCVKEPICQILLKSIHSLQRSHTQMTKIVVHHLRYRIFLTLTQLRRLR